MKLVKCKNGHYFDADATPQCPFCGSARAEEKRPYGEIAYVRAPRKGKEQDDEPVYRKRPRKETSTVHDIAERIMCWLFYSVFFSVLPIGINTALNSIFEFGIDNTDQYISDLFVITLVISSTTLKDIIDNKLWAKKQTMFLIIFFATFFLILVSSILCGAVTYCFLSRSALLGNIKNKLLFLSTSVSTISILIGLLMQIIGGVVDGI